MFMFRWRAGMVAVWVALAIAVMWVSGAPLSPWEKAIGIGAAIVTIWSFPTWI